MDIMWVEMQQILQLKVDCKFRLFWVFIKLRYATSLMHKFC